MSRALEFGETQYEGGAGGAKVQGLVEGAHGRVQFDYKESEDKARKVG